MILAGTKQSESGRSRRRMFPIHFYAGRNGAGKSLCAVYDTLPTLDTGRPVLSTVRLLDWRDPRPCLSPQGCDRLDWHDEPYFPHQVQHPCYVPFTKWEQLLGFESGDVLMDEVTGVADSNEHYSMPSAVRNILPQLRRRDIALRITGLNWIRADKRIREAVNAVTRCRSRLPVSRRNTAAGADRLWRPRRLIVAETFDAQSLPVDDHTSGSYDKADKMCRSRLWIPGSPAIAAYDTLHPVLTVGTVTDTGRCAYCGGTRRASECACADYVAAREARKGTARRAPAPEHGPRPANGHHAHGQDDHDVYV